MTKFAKDNGFIGWFETSAKNNHNVDNAFHSLIAHIIQITKNMQLQTPNNVNAKELVVLGKEAKKKSSPYQDEGQAQNGYVWMKYVKMTATN